MHDLFRFTVLPAVREHHARFTTYGGKSAYTAAKQLVAAARSHDLKVQRLVELAKLFGPETNAQRHGIIGGDYPAVTDQLRSTRHYSSIAMLERELKLDL